MALNLLTQTAPPDLTIVHGDDEFTFYGSPPSPLFVSFLVNYPVVVPVDKCDEFLRLCVYPTSSIGLDQAIKNIGAMDRLKWAVVLHGHYLGIDQPRNPLDQLIDAAASMINALQEQMRIDAENAEPSTPADLDVDPLL